MLVKQRLPHSFLSFDVEALPGRASSEHVDRLVWGKVDGGEYGLGRISQILGQYRIPGNFLVDFSMCELYGEKVVHEIVGYLLEQGHDVHVHLHPEWLIRRWNITGDWTGPAGMDRFDGILSRILLEYAAEKYWKLVRSSPVLYRSGSFLFSQHTVTAARRVGFTGLSNYNTERHRSVWQLSEEAAQNNPFAWDEDLAELPVDCSPEPLSSSHAMYLGAFDRSQLRKRIKTFNIVLHSTSLLQRNANGHFDRFSPVHEDRLHEICRHLASNTVPSSYTRYLRSRPGLPVLGFARCLVRPAELRCVLQRCPRCGRIQGRSVATDPLACSACSWNPTPSPSYSPLATPAAGSILMQE